MNSHDTVSPEDGSLAAALDELAALLMATNTFADLMQQFATLAVRTVPTALTCGITLAQTGRVITVASATPLADLLDEHQYERDHGPCLEAMETSTIVDAPDLSVESRWSDYPRLAMAHGVSSIYSSPMIVNDHALGVVNLYAAAPHAFDAPEARAAVAQAVALAGVAVTATLRNHGDVTLTEQLQTALNSRSAIDQAVGIVMATQNCSASAAFAILRGISQTRNVRLAVIARDLVERTGGPAGPT